MSANFTRLVIGLLVLSLVSGLAAIGLIIVGFLNANLFEVFAGVAAVGFSVVVMSFSQRARRPLNARIVSVYQRLMGLFIIPFSVLLVIALFFRR